MKVSDVTLRARWWRFDRYEIRDGYIRPASGSVLEEYDFFDDYVAPRMVARKLAGARSEIPGPHEDLANLADAAESDLLDWVHNWGLLGILPHQLEHVSFESGTSFLRESDGWRMDRPGDDYRPPSGPGWALQTGLDNGRKYIETAHAALAPFFPDCDWPWFSYPVPLTHDFWRYYAEPVDVVRAVARKVREVMLGLEAGKDVKPEDIAAGPDEGTEVTTLDSTGYGNKGRDRSIHSWIDWYMAHKWICTNAVFTPGMPEAIVPTPESLATPSAKLEAPTLMAVIATLMWMDLSESKSVMVCARKSCGKVFATGITRRQYCSDKCKKAEEMRRYRRRSSKKSATATQGDEE